MPIGAYLTDHSFDPEQIKTMSWALEEICNTLQVCDDQARQTIATRIIELTLCGAITDWRCDLTPEWPLEAADQNHSNFYEGVAKARYAQHPRRQTIVRVVDELASAR